MADDKKDWISGAIKKPGSLRKSLHVKSGEKIPAKKLDAAAKKGGKIGARARLAKTLEGMHKGNKPERPKKEDTKTDRGNFKMKG